MLSILEEFYMRVWMETAPNDTSHFPGLVVAGLCSCVFGFLQGVYVTSSILHSAASNQDQKGFYINTLFRAPWKFCIIDSLIMFLGKLPMTYCPAGVTQLISSQCGPPFFDVWITCGHLEQVSGALSR